jgi:hypothetical protein
MIKPRLSIAFLATHLGSAMGHMARSWLLAAAALFSLVQGQVQTQAILNGHEIWDCGLQKP